MDLKDILERELADYAGDGVNGHATLLQNPLDHSYALIAHGATQTETYTYTALYAALIGERVVIYEDRTDPSLAETLMQAGVPRDKLVLVYKGEPAPARTP